MNSRPWIFVLIAILAAGPVRGACGVGPEVVYKVIIGDVRRCESARFHLDAFAEAADWNLRELEANQNFKKGLEWTKDGVVIVVSVKSHFPIPLGWQADGLTGYRPEAQWIALAEDVRYWWLGNADECESVVKQRSVKLRVKSPCCDTLPYFGHCLLGMDTAEPLSPEMLAEFGEPLQRSLLNPSNGGKRSDDE